MREALRLPISPLVGEMSGRTEGGAVGRQPQSIGKAAAPTCPSRASRHSLAWPGEEGPSLGHQCRHCRRRAGGSCRRRLPETGGGGLHHSRKGP
ncbi:hypothetical protein D3227_20155 [Mesorhizobium waimense]|uniref:Propionyl-coenzyme A carboxylase alpha polypeptide n=1 Tax=Mesorhizobium waimense TaxID=1300307 RepID=A0A3A5KKY8_9HYPH|nr:hypothetical protein D3227_20155 [Mesorhizobium waimense]